MGDNNVNHPSHYNVGYIEVIDAIEDWKLGFHEGNVIKYVARSEHKGKRLEDLRKAAWYLNRLVQQLEAEENANMVVSGEESNDVGTK
jgi:hypothetical protein